MSILNEFTYCDLGNSEGGCLAYPVLNNFDENLPSNFVVGIAIDLDNGKLYSSMNGKWLDFDEKFVTLSKINNKNGFLKKISARQRLFSTKETIILQQHKFLIEENGQ